MSQNYIKRIAIVGAGGQSGSYMTKALIATGRFHITAITRPDSINTMPEGLDHIAKVNYDDKQSLVTALTGIDCLIITMSVFAGPQASKSLIEAAAEANVAWILPNEWGGDHLDPEASKQSMIGAGLHENRKLIRDLGKSSQIAVVCSFWYEYSLTAGEWAYGFDFDNKTVTLINGGDITLNTTTWEKLAEGVAALLSLPIHKDNNEADSLCLDDFKNGFCYVFSFRLTQKEMLASLLRVTGDKESDWTVKHEDAGERYARGMKAMQGGDRSGFGRCLYTTVFFPPADGAPARADYQGQGKSDNDRLGLKQEDLDVRTKVAVERYEKQGHMKM